MASKQMKQKPQAKDAGRNKKTHVTDLGPPKGEAVKGGLSFAYEQIVYAAKAQGEK